MYYNKTKAAANTNANAVAWVSFYFAFGAFFSMSAAMIVGRVFRLGPAMSGAVDPITVFSIMFEFMISFTPAYIAFKVVNWVGNFLVGQPKKVAFFEYVRQTLRAVFTAVATFLGGVTFGSLHFGLSLGDVGLVFFLAAMFSGLILFVNDRIVFALLSLYASEKKLRDIVHLQDWLGPYAPAGEGVVSGGGDDQAAVTPSVADQPTEEGAETERDTVREDLSALKKVIGVFSVVGLVLCFFCGEMRGAYQLNLRVSTASSSNMQENRSVSAPFLRTANGTIYADYLKSRGGLLQNERELVINRYPDSGGDYYMQTSVKTYIITPAFIPDRVDRVWVVLAPLFD